MTNRSAKGGGKVEPALWRRRRSHPPHRTKVFAGGTVWKDQCVTLGDLGGVRGVAPRQLTL